MNANASTREALRLMLRENTGVHFLDSGGAYGRHWQENAQRDFESEESSTLSFRHGAIEVTHRVFGWLAERVEYDDEANRLLDLFEEQNPELDYYELREEFPRWIADARSSFLRQAAGDGVDARERALVGEWIATGLYGDGAPITVNTYNEECLLDQTLLFTYFELRERDARSRDREAFIILQIHGGCDVRGGYSRPRVFRLDEHEELGIFDYAQATIHCEGGREELEGKGRIVHWWWTDDGCHFYAEGACGRGAGQQLEAYERVRVDDLPGAWREWKQGRLFYAHDESEFDGRTLKRGEGLCPICGGRLQASGR